jgi:hypothetical protein
MVVRMFDSILPLFFSLFLCVLSPRVISVNPEHRKQLRAQIQSDPNIKAVFSAPKASILYSNQQKPPELQYLICPESFRMKSSVIYTRRDFYLLDEMNNVIENLKSGGLIEFYHRQFFNRRSEQKVPKTVERLTVKQFLGSFFILFSGLLVSFTMFLMEVAIRSWKSRKRSE